MAWRREHEEGDRRRQDGPLAYTCEPPVRFVDVLLESRCAGSPAPGDIKSPQLALFLFDSFNTAFFPAPLFRWQYWSCRPRGSW